MCHTLYPKTKYSCVYTVLQRKDKTYHEFGLGHVGPPWSIQITCKIALENYLNIPKNNNKALTNIEMVSHCFLNEVFKSNLSILFSMESSNTNKDKQKPKQSLCNHLFKECTCTVKHSWIVNPLSCLAGALYCLHIIMFSACIHVESTWLQDYPFNLGLTCLGVTHAETANVRCVEMHNTVHDFIFTTVSYWDPHWEQNRKVNKKVSMGCSTRNFVYKVYWRTK